MEKEEKNRQDQLNKLMSDMKVSSGTEVPLGGPRGKEDLRSFGSGNVDVYVNHPDYRYV